MSGFDEGTWGRFIEQTSGRPPRELLTLALHYVPMHGNGLDLGCGAGNEARAMLRHGLRVLAIDLHPEAIRRAREFAATDGLDDRLDARLGDFSELPLPVSSFDLVHAGFSLPFSPPWVFEVLWERVLDSLRPRGVLAGQLFGVRDAWASGEVAETMSFHTRPQVEALLEGREVIHFEEVERHGRDAFGEPKYWHVFHVIVRDTRTAAES